MCGRFYLDVKSPESFEILGVQAPDNASIRNFNITPSMPIPITLDKSGERILEFSVWGLLPRWAKAKNMKPMINARSESADTKPYFRGAFKHHRCLIPATGFYEWKRDKGNKTPYAIALPDQELMVFAGLYEIDEDENFSCAILTTAANEQMETVHDRMPVILSPEHFSRWVENGEKDVLKPYDGELSIWPISKRVNSPKNNDERLIERVSMDTDLSGS